MILAFSLQSFSQALMFGPEMLAFHAVFLVWCAVFVVHLSRPGRRESTRMVLTLLAVICGLLAPLHQYCRDYGILLRLREAGGYANSYQLVDEQLLCLRGTLTILGTAILFLIVSIWTWRMPRPGQAGGD